MDKEKTLRKIKSCLALSESSNIEEANSALLKAQELMIKYRISEDDVKNFDKEKINKNEFLLLPLLQKLIESFGMLKI